MNEIVKLYNEHPVRIIQRDGEPWFVAKDVCDVLEIRNSRQATSYLEEDERDVITNDTPSGEQNMTVVSEAGLYSLILRSRKPEAKEFKRWITHEVLPSIRKTGAYLAPNVNLERLASMIKTLAEQTKQVLSINLRLREENEYLKQFVPKGDPGDPSKVNGQPKWQQRCGCYVSKNGRRPKRLNPAKGGYLQPDLFADYLPQVIIAETSNIFNMKSQPQLADTLGA